jgi:hypothetical protein
MISGASTTIIDDEDRKDHLKRHRHSHVMASCNYEVVMHYMAVPEDIDATVALKNIRIEKQKAKEARAMAWEDYFAQQRERKEREAMLEFHRNLESQIKALSDSVCIRETTLTTMIHTYIYIYEHCMYDIRQIGWKNTTIYNPHTSIHTITHLVSV